MNFLVKPYTTINSSRYKRKTSYFQNLVCQNLKSRISFRRENSEKPPRNPHSRFSFRPGRFIRKMAGPIAIYHRPRPGVLWRDLFRSHSSYNRPVFQDRTKKINDTFYPPGILVVRALVLFFPFDPDIYCRSRAFILLQLSIVHRSFRTSFFQRKDRGR